jgi:putative tricarboxylic transport membrane protein
MHKQINVVASLFLIIVGIVTILGSNGLAIGTIRDPGAGFFPFLGGIGLVVLSLILLVQALRGRSMGVQRFGELLRPCILVIGLLAYALLFDPAGYIITTIVLSVVVLLILEEKSWWVVGGVSVLIAVGTYFLFDRLLQTPLPTGILGKVW